MFADVSHFTVRPLLNDDVVAARNGQIDGGEWRRNVEGHSVVLGDNRNLVGADFVGRVSVGGNL